MKRFINADIIKGNIKQSTTLNQYAYVNGNPISFVDPFGLSAERGKPSQNPPVRVKDMWQEAWQETMNDISSWWNGSSYCAQSLRQLIYGNYGDEVTILGTTAQVATGFFDIDLPGDVRDLIYDLTNWKWSWSHAGQTGLDGISLFPAIGIIKYADEVGILFKHADETADALKGGSKASSKVLRLNLIDAGVKAPDYANAAHHIVAGTSKKASEAQRVLKKFGIDINDASNGVFLPTAKGVSNSAYHPSLHTNDYYNKVNDMLRGATSKDDVLDVLSDISEQLSKGTFIE